ncbi:MAG: type II toxin-antitoxin system HicB family antitoxin [Armatimonadota bacterium]
MTRKLSALITVEDGIYVAQCLEFDVASQGDTEQEALDNLKEAARLYVEELGQLPEWKVVPIEVEVSAAS